MSTELPLDETAARKPHIANRLRVTSARTQASKSCSRVLGVGPHTTRRSTASDDPNSVRQRLAHMLYVHQVDNETPSPIKELAFMRLGQPIDWAQLYPTCSSSSSSPIQGSGSAPISAAMIEAR